VLVTRLPEALPHLPLWLALATASAIASRQKLRLPLGNSSSNLSIAYTIDFASLLVLGPDATMLVALVSGWAQSTNKASRTNPAYRTIFNIAILVLTVQITGRAFELAGGRFGVFDPAMLMPLLVAVLSYFVINSILVATVIGLSSRQHLWKVWYTDFLWTGPSYFVGAAAASAAAAAWTLGWGWLIPLAAAPVYLTFRSYRVYLDRIAAETKHHTEIQALHEKAVEALRAAKESEQRYALAAAGSNDGLWDWDLTSDAFYVSDRWKLMLGLSSDVPIQRVDDWFKHVHPDDTTDLRRVLDRHLTGHTAHFEHEYRMRHQSGRYQWVLCRGVAVQNEQNVPIRIAGSQTDVTEQRRVQDDLQHAALHDGLTGLANRALFSELLERALSKTRRSASYVCAVLFIDLDHFKLVNDSYGHVIGDQFLVAIGKRLLQCLRPGDALARLGGDEFAILLDDVGESPVASVISERLHTTLRAPFELEGREIWASASIGIAFSNGHHQDPEELLRDADTAMYRSKAQGRSQTQTFDPSMHESAIGRLTLETELRRAIDRQEFVVYYQPIIELETRDVCGFESLIRWPREDGSITPPIDFIPVAEETGLIAPITRIVLFEACRQVAEWQRHFERPLTLTVNISTKLFDRPTLVAEVREAISSTGLLPGSLRLEITESFLVNGSDQVVARLDELRSIPVELYLDDFGTGFSSLSYLHRYRLDALKIDRSFISRIGELHRDAPIVASIVNLAKELGMGVIAEGVETVAQAERLVALECPHAQGYLFSHPLSVEDARAFLASQQISSKPTVRPARDLVEASAIRPTVKH
jgi:diguanylate cyclase (GGDEF)-like protein/PAS domain S-box-containing protein